MGFSKHKLFAGLASGPLADAALNALLTGGIHRRMAPQGTSPPYLIVRVLFASDSYHIGGMTHIKYTTEMVAWSQDESIAGSDAIHDTLFSLLQDKPFAVVGGTVVEVQRRSEVEYDDISRGGEIVYGLGHRWDITVNV